MLTGHRYRVILYFVVLVLCLSVCFAFAETPASFDRGTGGVVSSTSLPTIGSESAATPVHFLYYSGPGRTSFQPALLSQLVAEPKAAPVQLASADVVLQQLGAQMEHHRGVHTLFSHRRHLNLVQSHAQPQTAVLPDAAGAVADSNQ